MAKAYIPRKDPKYLFEVHKKIKQLGMLCPMIDRVSRLSVYTVFIVLAVMWILIPLASFAQQWEPYCEGENARWYYDSSSVKLLPDDKAQVVAKAVSAGKSGDPFTDIGLRVCQNLNKLYKGVQGEYSYDITQFEFNLKTDEVRIISVTYYDKNGKILCKDTPKRIEWSKIEADSCDRLLYQKLLVLWLGGKK
jgi:hypothetical protein